MRLIGIKRFNLNLIALLIAGLIFTGPVCALAAEGKKTADTQEKVDQGVIIVTAEKREENVQEIPASITVISDTQIEDYDLKSTGDIVTTTPNLYITTTGNGSWTTFASMRGVASAMTGNSTVGFYVDDIYYSNMDMSFYDIERIEVLRGPQGTLYGRNSEAGIINVITKKPASEWESAFALDVSSFNTYDFKGSVSGPLVKDDGLSFKTAIRYHESDGYFENKDNGSDDLGRVENTDARVTLAATPTEKLDLSLTADLQRYDSPKYAHFAPMDVDGDLRKNVDVDYDGESHNNAEGASFRAEYQMPGMSLVSITSGRGDDNYLKNDTDFTSTTSDTFVIDKDLSSYSQELRLVSDRKDSPLQWLGGIFLLSEDDEREYDYHMGAITDNLLKTSATDTLGSAAFGQVTYGFSNGLDLTLGLRYDREKKDFDYTLEPGPVFEAMGMAADRGSEGETFDAWLPKASLSYRLSEAIMPYVTVSRGFRSGGFNDVDEQGTMYNPEFSWNYELGMKTSWLNNTLQMNAALFYIDRTDMLVEVLSGSTSTVYIDNAAEAHSKGVELEVFARPAAGWELSAGAAYTSAEFDEYISGGDDFSGNKIIDSPEFTVNLNTTYRFENGMFMNASYRHIGEIYFDKENTRAQGSYGLLGAKVGYEYKMFDLYFYADNILDKEYATRAFEQSDTWYARAGAPLTFGGMFKMRF